MTLASANRKEHKMLRKRTLLMLVAVAAVGMILTGQVVSQDQPRAGRAARGARDPEAMRERMERFRERASERMKETLGVESEEEWKVMYAQIEKVQNLQRDAQAGGMRGMMGQFGGGRRGGRAGRAAGGRRGAPDAPQADQTDVQKKTQALQTLLENEQAKPADIKTALDEFRKAREKSRQELAVAQKSLREMVSVRQEAQLVLMGSLD